MPQSQGRPARKASARKLPAVQRRADASMDLLNQVINTPIDPDYMVAAAKGTPPARFRWPLAVIALIIGVMFTVAAVQTSRSAPAAAQERVELIDRIQSGDRELDEKRATEAALTAEVRQLQARGLGNDETARSIEMRLYELTAAVGADPVVGPGLAITVDDRPGTTSSDERVQDKDLRVLVNGLWKSGAEAIAINGHRLTALTSIRKAGPAITVDFRSLTRPYRVEAIGDPDTLQVRFVESDGGAWWNVLSQNYGLGYTINAVKEVTLNADPGLGLRYARKSRP